MHYTREELIIARMAREMKGERIGIGATILSDIAVRVAKLLYAPDLILLGGSYAAVDCDAQAIGVNEEWSGVPRSRVCLSWSDVFDIIRKGRFQIWMSPAQIDLRGNANMSVIGEWSRPRVQLVGARGLPDNLWGTERLLYHVKRHTPRHIVEKVDFICTLGFGRARDELNLCSGRPGLVVSDLGVFGWDAEGRFDVRTLHPGVTFAMLQERTGFKVACGPNRNFSETEPPTADELECIRRVIDPRGWRAIESDTPPVGLKADYMRRASD
jgi:acyl CoA:acetate/3-ketoacid CoA transferase beta subunit